MKIALRGLLGMAIFVFGSAASMRAAVVDEDDEQPGVQVLTRGPVHEAFAEPLTADPRPSPIIPKQPPPPIEEIPPDEKPAGDNVQWIPGYFAWDETVNDYVWVSGLWRAVPPGEHWVPGHWDQVADGWQWAPGFWAPVTEQEVVYLPPPPVSVDTGPTAPAPDADSLYAPGCWIYREGRYVWRPGFWYHGRPDWFYTPAHYLWTPAGYVFVEGFWDYPLDSRGLLFAPVRLTREAYERRGWRYQPRYVIGHQGLENSLFTRPGYGRYYFGDYYEPEYRQAGFVPWFDHHMSRNTADPLYTYARWRQRNDPQWEKNIRGLHKERVEGVAPRPPSTLTAQNRAIRDIKTSKTVTIGSHSHNVTDAPAMLKHVTVAAPLGKTEHKEFKLQPVVKERQAEEQRAAQQLRAAAMERQARETKIITEKAHPTRPADRPARAPIAVPKVTAPPRVAAPPLPAMPRHVEQPLPRHEVIPPIRVTPPKEKGKG